MQKIESRSTTPPKREQQSFNKTKKYSLHKIRIATIFGLIFITGAVFYNWSMPNHYFGSALNKQTQIAGSFGEVRKDHYHLGIDIRTGGREDMPVYALADGYIYRASMQRNGYGKALYIAHPNGLMSVYAHLNAFSNEITAVVNKQQALSEQWEQEMFFSSKKFPVKKGSLIAYSGNSGFSEGPHLHLEMRNSQTKTILNPVLAGINVSDNIAPSIKSVWLYTGTGSVYEKKGTEINFTPVRIRDKDAPVIVVDPVVRIGIEATDKNEESKFRLGIYHAQLFVDNKLTFEFKMDSIPISKERYVNASIDYAQWFHRKRIIQYLFRLPGNQFPAYQQSKEDGMVHLVEDRIHRITIIVKDASGNSKNETFRIRYKPVKTNAASRTELLIPGMPHKISKGSVVTYFSPHAFYDAVPFTITEQHSNSAGVVSKTVKVGDPAIPVHTRYRIQIKTSLHKNDPARKYVLMELKNGKEKIYTKGDWKGDYMDGSFVVFGTIRLIVDSIPPRLSPQSTKWWFDHGEIIRLECLDNTGNVENFTARIDGQWTPFEQKNNKFYYSIPDKLRKGRHCLQLEGNDQVGNTTIKKIDFVIR